MAMTLRLTEAETEALRRQAEREGRSMQEVARAAIMDWLTRHDPEHVQALFEETAALHARLIERLADT